MLEKVQQEQRALPHRLQAAQHARRETQRVTDSRWQTKRFRPDSGMPEMNGETRRRPAKARPVHEAIYAATSAASRVGCPSHDSLSRRGRSLRLMRACMRASVCRETGRALQCRKGLGITRRRNSTAAGMIEWNIPAPVLFRCADVWIYHAPGGCAHPCILHTCRLQGAARSAFPLQPSRVHSCRRESASRLRRFRGAPYGSPGISAFPHTRLRAYRLHGSGADGFAARGTFCCTDHSRRVLQQPVIQSGCHNAIDHSRRVLQQANRPGIL